MYERNDSDSAGRADAGLIMAAMSLLHVNVISQ